VVYFHGKSINVDYTVNKTRKQTKQTKSANYLTLIM